MVATLKLPPEMPAVYRVGRPNATPGEVFSAINSDYVFRNAAQAQALAHAKAGGAPTYAYQFGWRSPQFGGRLGAAHVLDVPFVFDTLRTPPALGFVGPAAPQELATRMHAAWVAFAKTGKPGWQAYDDAGRTVMRFDTVSTTVREGGERERALWSSVVY
jgi:carboxylesterase type B